MRKSGSRGHFGLGRHVATVTTASALILGTMCFSPVTAGLYGVQVAFGEEQAAAEEQAGNDSVEPAADEAAQQTTQDEAGQDATVQKTGDDADQGDAGASANDASSSTQDTTKRESAPVVRRSANATPTIETVDLPERTVNSGEHPTDLPMTLTAHMSDGSTQELTVSYWRYSGSNATAYVLVNGKVQCYWTDGAGQTHFFSAIVHVGKATITWYDAPEAVRVKVGTDPTPDLPRTVGIELSDGTREDASVEWDEVAPEVYESVGTKTVTGTATASNGSQKAVTCTVNVTKLARPVSAELPEVTTVVNQKPKLPLYVTVTRSDGTSEKERVIWDAVDKGKYAQPGTFQVHGNVSTPDNDALGTTATVTVVDAKVVPFKNYSVYTYVGGKPEMPKAGRVIYIDKDGTHLDKNQTCDITWDSVDTSEAGTKTISGTGTYKGKTCTFKCEVHVRHLAAVAKTNGVEQPTVHTPKGVSPELPDTITVNRVDGSKTKHSVTWDWSTFSADVNTVGTYERCIYGKIDTPDDDMIGAWATVVVDPLSIVSVDETSATTKAGTAPVLPETVTVHWNDGTTTQEKVVWDSVPESAYAKAGTFDVNGTVTVSTNASVASASSARIVAMAAYSTDEGTTTAPAVCHVTVTKSPDAEPTDDSGTTTTDDTNAGAKPQAAGKKTTTVTKTTTKTVTKTVNKNAAAAAKVDAVPRTGDVTPQNAAVAIASGIFLTLLGALDIKEE